MNLCLNHDGTIFIKSFGGIIKTLASYKSKRITWLFIIEVPSCQCWAVTHSTKMNFQPFKEFSYSSLKIHAKELQLNLDVFPP